MASKTTIKDCYLEMERILRLFLYFKNTLQDETMYKNELKRIFETKGAIEREKENQRLLKQANREAKKYGINRTGGQSGNNKS